MASIRQTVAMAAVGHACAEVIDANPTTVDLPRDPTPTFEMGDDGILHRRYWELEVALTRVRDQSTALSSAIAGQ